MIQIIMAMSLGFMFAGTVMAIEEPEFTIEKKMENYEIRSYPSVLVAETVVEATFEDSGNKAFRILADFIFGNNVSQTKIAMTAPVSQQAAATSEKIAMTAPVGQQKTSGGFLVQFTMPAQFTLETLPKPVDPRVTIRLLPPRRVAVFSYSGFWSESRFLSKLEEFRQMLVSDGLKATGEPVFARYNSPFQLWFLRRNEIWLDLEG